MKHDAVHEEVGPDAGDSTVKPSVIPRYRTGQHVDLTSSTHYTVYTLETFAFVGCTGHESLKMRSEIDSPKMLELSLKASFLMCLANVMRPRELGEGLNMMAASSGGAL